MLPRTFLVSVSLTGAIALASCNGDVRRPLWRGEKYQAIVAEFRAAEVLPSFSDTTAPGQRQWRVTVSSDFAGEITITGLEGMDRIGVQYENEAAPRTVNPARDYTVNLELRMRGSTLYVYRIVSLFSTEYRLAVYDLKARQLRDDWLVAPEDMPAVSR